MKRIYILLCLLLSAPSAIMAQSMQMHTVKKGETIFSISQKYGINVKNIVDFNEESLGKYDERTVENIKIVPRQVLIIPNAEQIARRARTIEQLEQMGKRDGAVQHEQAKGEATATAPPENHTVQAKETVYGLSRKYGITQDELKQANPQIAEKGGLKIGMVLVIPRQKPNAVVADTTYRQAFETEPEPGHIAPADEKRSLAEFRNRHEVQMDIMLPFFLEQNDSLSKNSREPQIYERSKPALSFYMGARLALDSLEKLGVKARVRVFDTGRNEKMVEQILQSNDFSKTQVIVGPLYAEIAEFLAYELRNEKAIIASPFSLRHNINSLPNIIQVTAPSASVIMQVQKYIAENVSPDAKIILVCDKQNSLAEHYRIQTILPVNNSKELISVVYTGSGLYSRINGLLDKQGRNVIIIPQLSSDMLNELTSVVENKQNTGEIELICYELDAKTKRYIDDHRLSVAEKTSLTYGERIYDSPSNAKAEEFRKKFRGIYGERPNDYAFQGFDLTLDMALRYATHSDTEKALTGERSQETANKYYYIKTPSGGYFNHDCFILRYRPDGAMEKVY